MNDQQIETQRQQHRVKEKKKPLTTKPITPMRFDLWSTRKKKPQTGRKVD